MKLRAIDFGIFCALFLLTVGVYAPVSDCGFVDFDDADYVSRNPHVAKGLTLDSLTYAWTTFDTGNWIPITWMSYLLDAELFGISPSAFHLINTFWHAANVGLIYLVLRRFTGAVGHSSAVAALFAVHPLHVESVAWVSERKDLLSMFWLLVCLLAYERFARNPKSRSWYAAVCASLALGLLSKSMLVTVPVLLLLMDYWPLARIAGISALKSSWPQRKWNELLLEKAPLFALAFLDGLITMAAQRSSSAVKSLTAFDPSWRLANAIRAVGWYLWKTIVPTRLSIFYPHPLNTIPWHQVALAAIVVLAISTLAWRFRREKPHLLIGWAWFLVSLLPVLGLVQVGTQAQADRYVYIPHLGLFCAAVWELAGTSAASRRRVAAAYLVLAAAVLACIPATQRQIGVWKNSLSLWSHAVAVDPENHLAHFNLGLNYAQREQFDEAVAHFRKAIEHPGMTLTSAAYLGDLHARRGEWAAAAHYFTAVLQRNPEHPVAKSRLPAVLSQLQRQREAARKIKGDCRGCFGSVDSRPECPAREKCVPISRGRRPSAAALSVPGCRIQTSRPFRKR